MNEPESNSDDGLDALFALARARRADTDKAEYAFETRLMARLRAERKTESVWARVSWRLMPFFAACVVGLAIWHSEVAAEADEAAQVAMTENPDAVDVWNNLN
jgi:hypothetical protein